MDVDRVVIDKDEAGKILFNSQHGTQHLKSSALKAKPGAFGVVTEVLF